MAEVSVPFRVRIQDFQATILDSATNWTAQTLFAVPMTCDGCAKDVSDALYKVKGITNVEPTLKDQLVAIAGTAAPSAIVEAIQATGRDAILRGSGATNSAAVSILETFHHSTSNGKAAIASSEEAGSDRLVRGLARMVQVSPTVTLVDLTLRGLAAGEYFASIREFGDLKDGAASTGPVWDGKATATKTHAEAKGPRGTLCSITVGLNGRGSAFVDRPFQIWEVVGHALVVSQNNEGQGKGLENDENTVVGVIARSAGTWDNDKTVCSCTGKTLWEERKEQRQNGML